MRQTFEQAFALHVPSSSENLAMIRSFVSDVAFRARLTEEESLLMAVAVDEACANVIEHAYGHDATKQVMVRAILDEDAIRFEIVDQGRGFDPTLIEPKDPRQLVKERASGGLGMGLIRRIMDEVVYHIVPGEKNELRMLKRIRRPG
ncbi:MAG: ATP-binding protein [Bryobacterales bacterium]|jgi:serine/threonine-protein kinase RsbW|nr:ATP-binding protein [Bryobacterales bacterium]